MASPCEPAVGPIRSTRIGRPAQRRSNYKVSPSGRHPPDDPLANPSLLPDDGILQERASLGGGNMLQQMVHRRGARAKRRNYGANALTT
jgi:hypothetical protein